MRLLRRALLGAAILVTAACGDDEGAAPRHVRIEVAYRISTPSASEGSPTLCDLDGDGALELVVPLASSGVSSSETMVVVADARTGELLWANGYGLHPYGSPACVQANGEGPEDVLVTGRTGDVVALDGATGAYLWGLSAQNPDEVPDVPFPAFVSPVVFDPERTIAATTLAGDRLLERPARLVVFTPSGDALAFLDAPDGAESYASPAIVRDAAGATILVFTTGGETAPGHVYLVRYDAPNALTVVASVASACDDGGFVASPHVADVDGDGAPEVIAADGCGVVHAIELDGSVRLAHEVGGYVQANPVSADLDGDGVLDIVVATSTFNPSVPTEDDPTSRVVGLRVDGTVLWSREQEGAIIASPVVIDADGDGADDVFVIAEGFPGYDPGLVGGGLFVLSGRDGAELARLPSVVSSGTPTGGDVDGDGALDLFVTDHPTGAPSAGSIYRLVLPDVLWDPGRAWMGFRGHPIPTGAR